MKSRKVIVFFSILIICTAILAIYHLNSREKTESNTVQLIVNGKSRSIDLEKLEYEQVNGIRLNGKGEEIIVNTSGIGLKELFFNLDIRGYSKVVIVSDDSYKAEVTGEEVDEGDRAYLLYENEELRLVVFGDKNSKRSVSNVVQIVIE